MTYLRAIAGVERGFAVRRDAWLDREFIERDDERVTRKHARVDCGYRFQKYYPTVDDMFASDWELLI